MTKVAPSLAQRYPLGDLVVEGKTKKIHEIKGGSAALVRIVSKDDLTAGDGKKHDLVKGKKAWANQTTCNVFHFLKECGIEVAFKEQVNSTSFIAPRCTMLPFEVVVRREAHGSYLKRHPYVKKGHYFPRLISEVYLKTKDKRWKDHELPCDDPLLHYDVEQKAFELFRPDLPIDGQEPFLVLDEEEVLFEDDTEALLDILQSRAIKIFLLLEKVWSLQGRRLVDFKVEFGYDLFRNLLLADVIDSDSWRLVKDGAYQDKQIYRDGGALSEVAEKYRINAELTGQFILPRQQIILWSGSDKDKEGVDGIEQAIGNRLFGDTLPDLTVTRIVSSMHKTPEEAVQRLDEAIQEVPNSVVIAYVGMSNGAGPTLSALSTVPVISVPANGKDCPEDVWSSLRMPSEVPNMTVMSPSNAVLSALNILALTNPRIYEILRSQVEKRRRNSILID